MDKNITIIGCGSLGGYLVENLIQHNNQLRVIDFDTVEEKNTINSIYQHNDIGMKKVEAIKNKFNSNKIKTYDSDFDDCRSLLPSESLVINCTDRNLSNYSDVDLRCCVSNEFLFLDARKQRPSLITQHGKYISTITKKDIKNCAEYVGNFLNGPNIYKFIYDCNYAVVNVKNLDLDVIKNQESDNSSPNKYIYNQYKIFKYVEHLPERIMAIVKEKEKKDIYFMIVLNEQNIKVLIPVENQTSFQEVASILNNIFMENLKEEDAFLVSRSVNNIYTIIPVIGGA